MSTAPSGGHVDDDGDGGGIPFIEGGLRTTSEPIFEPDSDGPGAYSLHVLHLWMESIYEYAYMDVYRFPAVAATGVGAPYMKLKPYGEWSRCALG